MVERSRTAGARLPWSPFRPATISGTSGGQPPTARHLGRGPLAGPIVARAALRPIVVDSVPRCNTFLQRGRPVRAHVAGGLEGSAGADARNMGGPEDLDESGFVDIGDLLIVLVARGPCE